MNTAKHNTLGYAVRFLQMEQKKLASAEYKERCYLYLRELRGKKLTSRDNPDAYDIRGNR